MYDFSTYLDSNDSFSATSVGTIYEDGQVVGDATLTITGELSNDMSFIAGEIIGGVEDGVGIIYYADLVSQTDEELSGEDY